MQDFDDRTFYPVHRVMSMPRASSEKYDLAIWMTLDSTPTRMIGFETLAFVLQKLHVVVSVLNIVLTGVP